MHLGRIVDRKVLLLQKVPLQLLKERADTISSALKACPGALTYNIVFPGDLGAAMRDILSRLGVLPTVAG